MSLFDQNKDISFAVDIHGITYRNPKLPELKKILSSLDEIDVSEQNEVWVSLPGDIVLSLSSTGTMIWEIGEEIEKTLSSVSRETASKIWLAAIEAKWDFINDYPWQQFD
jgi:hypothetical protein